MFKPESQPFNEISLPILSLEEPLATPMELENVPASDSLEETFERADGVAALIIQNNSQFLGEENVTFSFNFNSPEDIKKTPTDNDLFFKDLVLRQLENKSYKEVAEYLKHWKTLQAPLFNELYNEVLKLFIDQIKKEALSVTKLAHSNEKPKILEAIELLHIESWEFLHEQLAPYAEYLHMQKVHCGATYKLAEELLKKYPKCPYFAEKVINQKIAEKNFEGARDIARVFLSQEISFESDLMKVYPTFIKKIQHLYIVSETQLLLESTPKETAKDTLIGKYLEAVTRYPENSTIVEAFLKFLIKYDDNEVLFIEILQKRFNCSTNKNNLLTEISEYILEKNKVNYINLMFIHFKNEIFRSSIQARYHFFYLLIFSIKTSQGNSGVINFLEQLKTEGCTKINQLLFQICSHKVKRNYQGMVESSLGLLELEKEDNDLYQSGLLAQIKAEAALFFGNYSQVNSQELESMISENRFVDPELLALLAYRSKNTRLLTQIVKKISKNSFVGLCLNQIISNIGGNTNSLHSLTFLHNKFKERPFNPLNQIAYRFYLDFQRDKNLNINVLNCVKELLEMAPEDSHNYIALAKCYGNQYPEAVYFLFEEAVFKVNNVRVLIREGLKLLETLNEKAPSDHVRICSLKLVLLANAMPSLMVTAYTRVSLIYEYLKSHQIIYSDLSFLSASEESDYSNEWDKEKYLQSLISELKEFFKNDKYNHSHLLIPDIENLKRLQIGTPEQHSELSKQYTNITRYLAKIGYLIKKESTSRNFAKVLEIFSRLPLGYRHELETIFMSQKIVACKSLKQDSEALRLINLGLIFFPNDPGINLKAAEIALFNKDFKLALKHLKIFLSKTADEKIVALHWLLFVEAYIGLNLFDEAVESLNKAIKKDLAICLRTDRLNGHYSSLINGYAKKVDHNPELMEKLFERLESNESSIYNQMLYYLKRKNFEKARQVADVFFKLENRSFLYDLFLFFIIEHYFKVLEKLPEGEAIISATLNQMNLSAPTSFDYFFKIHLNLSQCINPKEILDYVKQFRHNYKDAELKAPKLKKCFDSVLSKAHFYLGNLLTAKKYADEIIDSNACPEYLFILYMLLNDVEALKKLAKSNANRKSMTFQIWGTLIKTADPKIKESLLLQFKALTENRPLEYSIAYLKALILQNLPAKVIEFSKTSPFVSRLQSKSKPTNGYLVALMSESFGSGDPINTLDYILIELTRCHEKAALFRTGIGIIQQLQTASHNPFEIDLYIKKFSVYESGFQDEGYTAEEARKLLIDTLDPRSILMRKSSVRVGKALHFTPLPTLQIDTQKETFSKNSRSQPQKIEVDLTKEDCGATLPLGNLPMGLSTNQNRGLKNLKETFHAESIAEGKVEKTPILPYHSGQIAPGQSARPATMPMPSAQSARPTTMPMPIVPMLPTFATPIMTIPPVLSTFFPVGSLPYQNLTNMVQSLPQLPTPKVSPRAETANQSPAKPKNITAKKPSLTPLLDRSLAKPKMTSIENLKAQIEARSSQNQVIPQTDPIQKEPPPLTPLLNQTLTSDPSLKISQAIQNIESLKTLLPAPSFLNTPLSPKKDAASEIEIFESNFLKICSEQILLSELPHTTSDLKIFYESLDAIGKEKLVITLKTALELFQKWIEEENNNSFIKKSFSNNAGNFCFSLQSKPAGQLLENIGKTIVSYIEDDAKPVRAAFYYFLLHIMRVTDHLNGFSYSIYNRDSLNAINPDFYLLVKEAGRLNALRFKKSLMAVSSDEVFAYLSLMKETLKTSALNLQNWLENKLETKTQVLESPMDVCLFRRGEKRFYATNVQIVFDTNGLPIALKKMAMQTATILNKFGGLSLNGAKSRVQLDIKQLQTLALKLMITPDFSNDQKVLFVFHGKAKALNIQNFTINPSFFESFAANSGISSKEAVYLLNGVSDSDWKSASDYIAPYEEKSSIFKASEKPAPRVAPLKEKTKSQTVAVDNLSTVKTESDPLRIRISAKVLNKGNSADSKRGLKITSKRKAEETLIKEEKIKSDLALLLSTLETLANENSICFRNITKTNTLLEYLEQRKNSPLPLVLIPEADSDSAELVLLELIIKAEKPILYLLEDDQSAIEARDTFKDLIQNYKIEYLKKELKTIKTIIDRGFVRNILQKMQLLAYCLESISKTENDARFILVIQNIEKELKHMAEQNRIDIFGGLKSALHLKEDKYFSSKLEKKFRLFLLKPVSELISINSRNDDTARMIIKPKNAATSIKGQNYDAIFGASDLLSKKKEEHSPLIVARFKEEKPLDILTLLLQRNFFSLFTNNEESSFLAFKNKMIVQLKLLEKTKDLIVVQRCYQEIKTAFFSFASSLHKIRSAIFDSFDYGSLLEIMTNPFRDEIQTEELLQIFKDFLNEFVPANHVALLSLMKQDIQFKEDFKALLHSKIEVKKEIRAEAPDFLKSKEKFEPEKRRKISKKQFKEDSLLKSEIEKYWETKYEKTSIEQYREGPYDKTHNDIPNLVGPSWSVSDTRYTCHDLSENEIALFQIKDELFKTIEHYKNVEKNINISKERDILFNKEILFQLDLKCLELRHKLISHSFIVLFEYLFQIREMIKETLTQEKIDFIKIKKTAIFATLNECLNCLAEDERWLKARTKEEIKLLPNESLEFSRHQWKAASDFIRNFYTNFPSEIASNSLDLVKPQISHRYILWVMDQIKAKLLHLEEKPVEPLLDQKCFIALLKELQFFLEQGKKELKDEKSKEFLDKFEIFIQEKLNIFYASESLD